MKMFFYFNACFFSFLLTIYATGSVNPGCLEKEKALALLETAENLLSKAKDSLPSCKEDVNSTDESECGGKKPFAYIEISKKLISDVRKNFPTCSKTIEKDDKIVEDVKHRNCSEIFASGQNKSGVYTIWAEEAFTNGKSLQVYCDMETEQGGWTMIQRRGTFPVQQDFFLDWESYKNGFGNITQEFWLGNENIRVLCLKGCKIRFDLQNEDGEKGFALYQSFNLSSGNYRLSINGYTGNIGDGMKYHRNYDFSTKDKGNTERANRHKGGWWYMDSDYYCNLNGIYQPGLSSSQNVHWYTWRGSSNLASVEMKVRPM